MKRPCPLSTLLWILSLVLSFKHSAFADVFPGDVLDSTNWNEVKGLVPDSVLSWVKEGKVVLDIGELSYEPRRYFPSFVLEGFEKNAGRYALDDDHWIVEAETDKNMRLTILGDTIYVDARSGHATLGVVTTPKIIQTYFADLKVDCFSLAGFHKFCK